MKKHAMKPFSAVVLALSMLLAFSAPASAHDPIFMADDQITPDTGPYMPDGSISWALYGTVLDQGDTRGFEFDLRDGDEVFVSLLIPNLSPETELSDDELPIIELEAPDGTVTTITPVVRDVFDEPFSGTSYVTLAEHREPAQAGRYRGVIIGGAPSRFSVAIGETEIFFTETERSGERPTNFAEITGPLTEWYTTLPGGERDTSAAAEGEGEIDLDMIEDAMDSGEAQAPEGSLDTPEEAAPEAPEPEAEPTAVPESAPESEPEPEPTDAPEPEPTQEEAEPATTETASAPAGDSGGSGATWVAPVVAGAIAVLGAGAYFARRGRSE